MKFINIVSGVVVDAFSGRQDEEAWPALVEVEDDDPRYLDFVAPPKPIEIKDPMEKLKAFLDGNPDVAELLK